MYKKIIFLQLLLTIIQISYTIRIEENDKDLPNNFEDEEEHFDRKKRPTSSTSGCNFNKKKPIKVYKTDGSGRTFVDFIFYNTEVNYAYNINCGSSGSYPGHHKPGHQKPGHNKPFDGGVVHRPHKPFLAGLVGNRPLQQLFGHSSAQAESQSTGVFGNIVSSFSGFLPSPQDFGQGLGEGISSFIQTIPQIGQSFQSLFFGGSQATQQNYPADEILKPVHEDFDPVTDPYKTRFRF